MAAEETLEKLKKKINKNAENQNTLVHDGNERNIKEKKRKFIFNTSTTEQHENTKNIEKLETEY